MPFARATSQLAESLVAAGIAKARFDIVRDRLDQLDGAIDARLDDIRTAVDDGPGRARRRPLW